MGCGLAEGGDPLLHSFLHGFLYNEAPTGPSGSE
jgi:hypothetical protein